MEQYGVKETSELLVGVNELAIEIVSHLKDGAQLSDAVAILEDFKTNPDLLAKLLAAKDGVAQVPEEIKDLSIMEAVQLGMVQMAYVPKILSAAKA